MAWQRLPGSALVFTENELPLVPIGMKENSFPWIDPFESYWRMIIP
jgi:hypothetical protein